MKEKFLLGYIVFIAAAMLIRVITRCILLKKGGKRWWFGVLPIVSEYQILHISWKRRWLPMYLLAEIIRSFIIAIGEVFIKNWTMIIGAIISPVFIYSMTLLGIIYFVFMITLCANLSLHFGKSKEFGFVMALFPIICGPILAFGKSEYIKDVEGWMVVPENAKMLWDEDADDESQIEHI